jgi:hypothetical protein
LLLQVLEQAFDYLDEKYGGRDAYLDFIGFSQQYRDKLKQNFVFLPPTALLSPGGKHVIDTSTGKTTPHPPKYQGATFFSEVIEEAVRAFTDVKSRYSQGNGSDSDTNRQKGPRNVNFLTSALGSAVSTFATGMQPNHETKKLVGGHEDNEEQEEN